jgi:hypothetical protein
VATVVSIVACLAAMAALYFTYTLHQAAQLQGWAK